jgi:acid phosphatase family membrane protein YuiD
MIKELVLSIVITWIFVKLVKTIIAWFDEKKISFKVLLYDGGMPSSHTALVVSAATALYLETGFSTVFVLSIILALIVINDALKVRYVTGEQSKAINKLMSQEKDFKKLDEHLGHKPMEVFVSLIISIIIPVIIYSII